MLGKFRITNIFYLVADLDRTERFYREAVGLEVTRVEADGDDPPFLCAPTAGGLDLLFFPGEPKPGNSPIPVFDLAEGGIDRTVDGLVAAGATIVTPVSHAPGGWSAELADPDGHQLSMYQSAEMAR